MPQVVDRARERSEVVDEVDGLVDLDRLDHVAVHERERIVPQVVDVLERRDDEVVDADDAVAALEQRLAEVGAEEARAAGHDRSRHSAMVSAAAASYVSQFSTRSPGGVHPAEGAECEYVGSWSGGLVSCSLAGSWASSLPPRNGSAMFETGSISTLGHCARCRRIRRRSLALRNLRDRRGGEADPVAQEAHSAGAGSVTPLPGGPQRRSLFASMSNHMAKSVICRPAISSTATSTIVGVVISFPAIRRTASMTPRMKPADVMSTPKT